VLARLRQSFEKWANASSESSQKSSYNVQAVNLPQQLYSSYLQVFIMTCAFATKLEEVMDDEQHAEIMDEARAKGYRLPDPEIYRSKLETLTNVIENMHPHDIKYNGADYVCMSGEMARDFFLTAILGCDLINDVYNDLLNTDYLKVYKDLKDKGEVYSGPTSLQEAVDTVVCLIRANNMSYNYRKNAGLPSGWKNNVSGWRNNK
jgi:hypothetical protein